MIAESSVKRPYTVLVVAILVIVFGVVAFMRSTMDLMPKVDLPYVAVVTAWPGATPEQVETAVSRPMEQQMASLEELSATTSVSYDNYSMILLEFNNGADLSTVSSDIRDKIDLVSGSFDDGVSRPIIFKMNPDIMPVVIAAISQDKKSTAETSALIKEELQRQLEGIDGVASLSTAGLLDDKIHIALDQDKIEQINARLKEAAGDQLKEAKDSLQKGVSQAKSGEAQVSKGKSELQKAQKELTTAKGTIRPALATLQSLTSQRDAIDMLGSGGIPGLESLQSNQTVAQQLAQGTEGAKTMLDEQIKGIVKQLSPYKSQLKQFRIDPATAAESSTEAAKALATFDVALDLSSDQLSNQMSELAGTDAYLQSLIQQLQASQEQVEAQQKTAEESADASGLLTIAGLSQILQAQNFSMPAGYVSDDGKDVIVTVGDEYQSKEQIEDAVVLDPDLDGMDPVRIRDVATVSYMSNGADSYAKVDGRDGILLSFSKQSDYATTQVADNIKEEFSAIEGERTGVHFTTFTDQGKYIGVVIHSVLQNLLLGAVLAILILLLFLRDVRPTLITACSIFLSVTFAFVLMYFTGVTLNVISMAGLAVGVGMLVDNAIVVIENYYRLRAAGKSRYEAAVAGTSQVAGAITASTLTTISVFIPIVFVQGITRQIFTDMALTVSYALLSSLIVALTLVPVMGRGLIKKAQKRTLLAADGKGVSRYGALMNRLLDHKALTLIIALILFGGSIALMGSRGLEYIPSMASEEVSATIQLSETESREEAFAAYDEISEEAQKLKGVKTTGIMLESDSAGIMGMSGSSADNKDYDRATMYLILKEDQMKRGKAIVRELEKIGTDHQAKIEATAGMDVTEMSALGGGGISIDVFSDDMGDLQTAARMIEAKMRGMKSLKEVSDSREETVEELRISVDKDKAIKRGLTTSQIYSAVSSRLARETQAITLKTAGTEQDVVISQTGGKRISREDLMEEELTIAAEKGTVKVKIGDVAGIHTEETLSTINHRNQKRTLTVSAGIRDGYNTTKTNDRVKTAIDSMDLPSSVTIDMGGRTKAIMDAMKQLLLMLALGVLMIYLIMVAQFQSLRLPFIVMITVPLAFTGGLLGLLLTGNVISVVAMLGFVLLAGVIVNNAIVLIDYTNQLVRNGMDLREAVVLAGKTRMRPVLMTALTTVLGLVPLALAMGTGAEMMQPVAIVCIGGLLYGTLTTLILIPLIYETMMGKRGPGSVDGAEAKMI